jgi:hypothetical protein
MQPISMAEALLARDSSWGNSPALSPPKGVDEARGLLAAAAAVAAGNGQWAVGGGLRPASSGQVEPLQLGGMLQEPLLGGTAAGAPGGQVPLHTLLQMRAHPAASPAVPCMQQQQLVPSREGMPGVVYQLAWPPPTQQLPAQGGAPAARESTPHGIQDAGMGEWMAMQQQWQQQPQLQPPNGGAGSGPVTGKGAT